MKHVRRVVVGLGSNLGDRRSFLEKAVVAISALEGVHMMDTAPVYETPPQGDGIGEQGDFLNSAVLLLTALDAVDLWKHLMAIERALGRVRESETGRWMPRVIDLDLLWIEGEQVSTSELQVPHPRLAERTFALKPLLDVAADARDPTSQTPLSTLPAAGGHLKIFSA